MRRPSIRLITIAAVAVVASSCGGSSTTPKSVASVTISPASPSVTVGATQQMTAAVKDASGNALSNPVTWTTGDNAVATVSSTGLALGVAIGSTAIYATAGGVFGSDSITVLPIPVSTVAITPATPSIAVGASTQLSAVLKDAGGNVLTGRVVTWSSNNAAATVSSTGLVTGVSTGSATITATSEGKSGTTIAAITALIVNYEGYKKGGATALPATLTLNNGVGGSGTLAIDFLNYTVNPVHTGNTIDCLVGAVGSGLTACASLSTPHVMLICSTSSGSEILKYVLFDTNDGRVGSNATNLLAALQSGTSYLGIGVYTTCSGTFGTSWIRNYPNTNYYLWPDVFTTYSSATVSGLLTGMPIFSTATAGTDWNKFAVVRSSSSVFEVWH